MSLHKLYRLISGGNIYARACVSLGFGIRVHLFTVLSILFFAVPAVGTQLAGLDADSLDDTRERLELY